MILSSVERQNSNTCSKDCKVTSLERRALRSPAAGHGGIAQRGGGIDLGPEARVGLRRGSVRGARPARGGKHRPVTGSGGWFSVPPAFCCGDDDKAKPFP